MDEIEKLKGALEKIPGKRVTAKLSKLMPFIDQRISDGISHEEIIETLNANGLSINLNTFRTSLYRYRKALRKNATLAEPSQANSNLLTDVADSVSADLSTSAPTSLDDMLDARKRDALGEKYLHRKPPVLKNKRSNT